MPNADPTPEFVSPEARCTWVYTEHCKGRPLKNIAEMLGVSPSRAGQLNAKGRRLVNPKEFWFKGLSARTANRLVERGFTSREQVEQAVRAGVITDKPSVSQREFFESDNQQTTIPGLGAVSFAELLEWLRLPGKAALPAADNN